MWQVAKTAKTMDSARHSSLKMPHPTMIVSPVNLDFRQWFCSTNIAQIRLPLRNGPPVAYSRHMVRTVTDLGRYAKTLGQKPLPRIAADRLPRGWLCGPARQSARVLKLFQVKSHPDTGRGSTEPPPGGPIRCYKGEWFLAQCFASARWECYSYPRRGCSGNRSHRPDLLIIILESLPTPYIDRYGM